MAGTRLEHIEMEGVAVLDVALVPAGLVLLLLYHARLLYLLLFHPLSTVIGLNTASRKLWVRTMMADGLKNGMLAVQTLRNHMEASTLLATATIALCSVIAVLTSSHGNSPQFQHNLTLFLGDQGSSAASLKLCCIFVCFLMAFLCSIQSVRYYSHVSFLISIPLGASARGLTQEYISTAMVRGGLFWSIGLRFFYISLPLCTWLFGPIPMLASSAVLVLLLHYLDMTMDPREKQDVSSQDDIESALSRN